MFCVFQIFAVDLVNASAPVCISVCTHSLHRCEQLEWSSQSQSTQVGAVVHSGPAAVPSFSFCGGSWAAHPRGCGKSGCTKNRDKMALTLSFDAMLWFSFVLFVILKCN